MDGHLVGTDDFAVADGHCCVSDDHLAEMDGQAVAKDGRLPDLLNGFLVVAYAPLAAMDGHFVAEDGFHGMDIHFVETGLVDSVEKDGQSDESDDWSDVVSSQLVVIVVTSGCYD